MQKDGLKIIKDKLTNSEIKIIRSEIRESPDMTGYSLSELLQHRNVFKAYKNNELAGACINSDFGENWTEIGGFIVLHKFRRQEIGKLLYRTGFEDAIKRHKNIYITSRNPAMIRILKNSDLKITTSFLKLPKEIQLHSLRFTVNWFRFWEAIRKTIVMNKSGRLIYGYKKL
ncbi:MAG TPA: GNAT family N-acetyltransferase [Patescibacteria group bacterium]|nr:GNAT family N-acetyltransferase [Patescibacteria group bacterium]